MNWKSNFTKLIVVMSILAISCQKNASSPSGSADNVMAEPTQPGIELLNTSTHELGAILHDKATYESFKKLDVKALKQKMVKDATAAGATSTASVLTATTLPTTYAIPGNTPGDQGREGSCVAWATAYAASSLLEHNFKGVAFPTATRSPEYVYNQIKLTGSCASGSYISSGLDLIKSQGVCSWSEMPYTDVSCKTKPNTTQKKAASTHKLVSWSAVVYTSLSDVKNLLAMNIPVIIAVTVDANFDNMANTGYVWKSHSGAVRGGHAITVVGFDDSMNAFKVQNSWGTSWGLGGYFWIDYTFFTKSSGGAVNEAYAAYVQ
jgi:C1A family cysteine protease